MGKSLDTLTRAEMGWSDAVGILTREDSERTEDRCVSKEKRCELLAVGTCGSKGEFLDGRYYSMTMQWLCTKITEYWVRMTEKIIQ